MSIQTIHSEHKYPGDAYGEGVGERLQAARNDAGLTQEEARLLLLDEGIKIETYGTISGRECGHKPIKVDFLLAACRIYNASPLWVIADVGPRRWSDLGKWLDQPELYAIETAIDRITGMLAEAPAAVRESAAAYLKSTGDALRTRE